MQNENLTKALYYEIQKIQKNQLLNFLKMCLNFLKVRKFEISVFLSPIPKSKGAHNTIKNC